MLGEAFSAIGSAFSTRFVLGQFFPTFVMLTLNLTLGCLYVWGLEPSVAYMRDHLQIASLSAAVGLVASAACAVAFTIAPLVNALERALEGDFFWTNLRDRLAKDLLTKALTAKNALDAQRKLVDSLKTSCADTRKQIPAAPKRPSTAAPAAFPPPNSTFVHRIADAFESMRHGSRPRPSVRPAQAAPMTAQQLAQKVAGATAAIASMAAAQDRFAQLAGTASLEENSKWTGVDQAMRDVVTAAVAANKILASFDFDPTLEKSYDDKLVAFIGVQEQVKKRADRQLGELGGGRALELDTANPKPTRYGNLRAALEAYPRRVYNVDYNFLWPRLLLVVAKEDPNAAILDQRRAQLDFTLLAMALVLASFVGWLLTLAASDVSWLRYLAVSVAAPIVMTFFYEIALAAQRSFTELAEGFFDRYRFALLKALHAKLPDHDDTERALWQQLAGHSAGFVLSPPLPYDHTP